MMEIFAKIMLTATVLFFVAWAATDIVENERLKFAFAMLGVGSVATVLLSLMVLIWMF